MSGVTRHDFGQIRKATHDLEQGEQVIRKRLADLADRASDLEQLALPVARLIQRDFWGRLNWLLRGR